LKGIEGSDVGTFKRKVPCSEDFKGLQTRLEKGEKALANLAQRPGNKEQ
jgi:hypothetical protein